MNIRHIVKAPRTGFGRANAGYRHLSTHSLSPFVIDPLHGREFFTESNKDGRPTVYLAVTVDTEEDQWGLGNRDLTTSNISRIPRLQSIFDEYGVLPTYLISLPVAENDKAMKILTRILDNRRCEIGSHLHPWITPPVREELVNKSTMLSNLPFDLQMDKLVHLTDVIAQKVGQRPRSFRAGRWGLGPDTVRALVACDYIVDSSVTPFVSWRVYDGPSFYEMPVTPFVMHETKGDMSEEKSRSILEVPPTIGYNRWFFHRYPMLGAQFDELPSWLNAKGLASRMNIMRKIWLSPELNAASSMIILSRVLIKRGVRVLNMSFHSSSLVPGLTPFVRSDEDLERFYRRLTSYFDGLHHLANVKPVVLSGMADWSGSLEESFTVRPA